MQVSKVKAKPKAPKLTRVCAYTRVSTGKDAMLHSLAAQVDYYSTLIRHHAGWEYVGVYSDEAQTGTKETRENFQRMITDAKAGKIDLIITKSISRFARNTLTLLSIVRDLKDIGVDVFFEEQNVHTISAEGELMLTLLASFAQEESLSVSENLKWRIKKNFEAGIPWGGTMLGYRFEDGKYVVIPEDVPVVQFIFREYLAGKGLMAIAKELNDMGAVTRFGNTHWGDTAVRAILCNYTYTGNLLLQKTYREDHLTKNRRNNTGELPRYHVEGAHEVIIDQDTFDAVQREMELRRDHFYNGTSQPGPTHFPARSSAGSVANTTATGSTNGSAVPISDMGSQPVHPS